MTENPRLLWLLSRPACAEVAVNYNTGEQNKNMATARQGLDWKDTLTVLQYLQERNPFRLNPSLQSISTGVHAHLAVNVDKAVAIGVKQMNVTAPADYYFRRKTK